jgi:hypothetical protein
MARWSKLFLPDPPATIFRVLFFSNIVRTYDLSEVRQSSDMSSALVSTSKLKLSMNPVTEVSIAVGILY